MGEDIEVEFAGETRIFPSGTTVHIGRAEDAEISTRNRNVSRQHGELREVSGRWTYFDVGSSQGTFVAGDPVTELPISGRVELSLGRPGTGDIVGLRVISDREWAEDATVVVGPTRPPVAPAVHTAAPPPPAGAWYGTPRSEQPPPLAPTAEPAPAAEPARRRPSALAIVLGVVVVIVFVALGIALAGGSHAKTITAHGTFTISNATYDPTNEFETPNYHDDGAGGCEGAGGYGDLNSITQVVVTDDHGKEVTRTELGQGNESSDECVFDFTFDVSQGPKYFVVSVGRRGESQYTFEQLQEPGAVALIIGNN